MFYHGGSPRRQNEHDGGGNVEHVDPITAGPAHIDHRAVQSSLVDVWIDCPFQKQFDKVEYLISGFAFSVKFGEKLRLLIVIHCLGKQQAHRVGDIAAGKVKAVGNLLSEIVHSTGM